MSAAHRSASARVFVENAFRCGKIEKSTTPTVRSSGADGHSTKYSPIRGVITMLPALTPTQTVLGSDGRRSASPDCRIQWHRYVASPPSTSRTSASRTQGIHRSSPMLGSAVSSSTPTDLRSSRADPDLPSPEGRSSVALRRGTAAECRFDSFEPAVELTELLRHRRLGVRRRLLTL